MRSNIFKRLESQNGSQIMLNERRTEITFENNTLSKLEAGSLMSLTTYASLYFGANYLDEECQCDNAAINQDLLHHAPNSTFLGKLVESLHCSFRNETHSLRSFDRLKCDEEHDHLLIFTEKLKGNLCSGIYLLQLL